MTNYYVNDYNKGRDILRLLGSYWQDYFEDNDRLRTMLRAGGHTGGQTYINFLEAIASLSRFNVPIFHQEMWYHLTLLRSDLNSFPAVYGEGYTYGGGLVYNDPNPNPDLYEFPLPDAMRGVPGAIQNTVIRPSLVWQEDADFEIDADRGILRFKVNPFSQSAIPVLPVYDDDRQHVDDEISLWVYRGHWDLEHIWEHFGYVLGLQMESSLNYRNFLNSVWDAYVEGLSVSGLEQIVSSLSGIPTVINESEVVKVITTEGGYRKIITDSNVYSFVASASETVSVGDTVYQGDFLIDAVDIIELSSDNSDISSLTGMSVGRNFLSGEYISSLTVENKLVSLETAGTNDSGAPLVVFEVSGYQADIDQFWSTIRTNEASVGKTLAEYMEEAYGALPDQVNPLSFILENFFKNNMFILRLSVENFRTDALSVKWLSVLRKVVPPNTGFIVFLENTVPTETVELSGTLETVNIDFSPGPLTETVNLAATAETIVPSIVAELCG